MIGKSNNETSEVSPKKSVVVRNEMPLPCKSLSKACDAYYLMGIKSFMNTHSCVTAVRFDRGVIVKLLILLLARDLQMVGKKMTPMKKLLQNA